jgi:hypothetical protein
MCSPGVAVDRALRHQRQGLAPPIGRGRSGKFRRRAGCRRCVSPLARARSTGSPSCQQRPLCQMRRVLKLCSGSTPPTSGLCSWTEPVQHAASGSQLEKPSQPNNSRPQASSDGTSWTPPPAVSITSPCCPATRCVRAKSRRAPRGRRCRLSEPPARPRPAVRRGARPRTQQIPATPAAGSPWTRECRAAWQLRAGAAARVSR